MVCPRCGAVFEGNFCPRCGLPAALPPSATAPVSGRTCPRCGTSYVGNFCPRCGLPAVAVAYQPIVIPPPPSGGRSFLSILWTLAIAGVFFLMALNVVALLLSPGFVLPGIQGMAQGRNPDPGLTGGVGNWTFVDLTGTMATGVYSASGGNPGAYLSTTLPAGTNLGGMWEQPFRVTGTAPFIAQLRLDVEVVSGAGGPQGGRLVASVEPVANGLDLANASAVVWVNGTQPWTTTAILDVSGGISNAGTYYLKLAFLAAANAAPATVGFANIDFAWATDAYFYVIGPFPLPTVLYFSTDPATLEATYFFVIAAILIPAAYYLVRERKVLARTLTAPLSAIGVRLRSMSAWVAVAQVWLAANFFQFVVIIVVEALGGQTTSPINITPANTWYYLYDLARASVFEELLFRALPIGVPMAVGALIVRWQRGDRAHAWGALRYLWGGQLRKESSNAALLTAGILVLASSAIFGAQHYVGWGWWKTLPAAVAGLAFAYLFVRHGLGAAILAHFLNDYLSAILLEGVGGAGLEAIFVLLYYVLVAAGAGFLVWYLIDGWTHLRDFRGRLRPRVLRQPVAAGMGPVSPPGAGFGTMAPPGWLPYPPPAPPGSGAPPGTGYAPPPQAWPPPPPVAAAPRSPFDIPRGYTPTYHPAPYGYPPVRFQCPACGWIEAKYENRHFTCLRCGRTA